MKVTETHILDNCDFALLDALLSPRLKPGPRQRTIVDLFGRFSSLREIIHAPPRTLKAITKCGGIAYEELQKARKLAIALARVEIRNRPVLTQYKAIIQYCRTLLAGERRELFFALFLNKADKLVGSQCLQSGTIDHVFVYPRELFDCAMEHAAASIILVHNHPGGSPQPSRADIAMTKTISMVGRHLGIKLKDHIIIGKSGTYSFRQKNRVLLPGNSNIY